MRKASEGSLSNSRPAAMGVTAKAPIEAAFSEVVSLIRTARQRVAQVVNTDVIDMYWHIGQYLHHKIEADGWAKGTVVQLAAYIAQREPGKRGFSSQNLWRMRQFFLAYPAPTKLSTLVRVLPWTHNLIILAQSKRADEREFYLRMAVQQRWGKRELERQIRVAAFENAVLTPPKLSPAVREVHGDAAAGFFKDAYAVEFLDLPADHTEGDLHRGLLGQLRSFLIELGRDFCFIGSEFPVQVGGRDAAMKILFLRLGCGTAEVGEDIVVAGSRALTVGFGASDSCDLSQTFSRAPQKPKGCAV